MKIENRWLYVGAAGVAVVVLGAGYYLGRHGLGSAYADVAETPQMVASTAGAPSVPGLCVLSQNAVYANAEVGLAATARYRQLTSDLRGQLMPEQQAIQDAAKKLEGSKTSIPAAQYQQQQAALGERIRQLQNTNAQDTKDLEATRVKALRQIAQMANPVISEVYKDRHCGALFSRDAMLVGNPGMDLTQMVVQGLDAKVQTIAFDLERVPANAPAQAVR